MQTKQHQIFCLKHPDSPVNRISPDPKSSQHAYCLDCLIQMEDGPSLYKKLVTLSSFIDTSAVSFAKFREEIEVTEQPEKAYLDVKARKAESLSRLSTHLMEQKEQTNKVYDELKSLFTIVLEKFRQRDLQRLDQELEKMNKFYENFEETLRIAYPIKEELYSFEDLQKKLEGIDEPDCLQKYIQKIKQTISDNEARSELDFGYRHQRKELLDGWIRHFEKEEPKKPSLKRMSSDIKHIENEIERHFTTFFESSVFYFQDCLNPKFQVMSVSKFANFQDFKIIKNWLPDGYKFYPKLLYRASKHGFINDKFHELCDKKGPTITLIHCLFEGAKEPVIIGGFLDQNWSSNGESIWSQESFLFSLSSKIKCRLRNSGTAAYGAKGCGPAFCGSSLCGTLSYELVINRNSKECYLSQKYFFDSAKLANYGSWNGEGQKKFKLLDYEVFAID